MSYYKHLSDISKILVRSDHQLLRKRVVSNTIILKMWPYWVSDLHQMKYYNWNFKFPQVQYRLYGETKKMQH
jgi:hypothetical protein